MKKKRNQIIFIIAFLIGGVSMAWIVSFLYIYKLPLENLGEGYLKDISNVYYHGNRVVNALPDSFILIGDGYAYDSDSVYYFGKRIQGADPQTFEVIYEDYSKDKDVVYFRGTPFRSLDVQTFEVLDSYYNVTRDANGEYKDFKGITGAPSVRIDTGKYGFVEGNGTFRLYDGFELGLLDGNFEILEGDFIVDDASVYYQIYKLQDVDKDSFEVLENGYAVDVNGVYFQNKVLNSAKKESFQILQYGYSKDGNNIYYEGERLPDSQGRSFNMHNEYYASDSKWLYYQGQRIDTYHKSFALDLENSKNAKSDVARYEAGIVTKTLVGNWKLVSGNPKDSCRRPSYEGKEKIRGWYIWDNNYVSKEWLFRVADEDLLKLPLDMSAKINPRIEISNISPKLEEKLKEASEQDPYKLTLTSFSYYCEGVPWADVEIDE